MVASLALLWSGLGGPVVSLIAYFPPIVWAFPAFVSVGWFLLRLMRMHVRKVDWVAAGALSLMTLLLCGIGLGRLGEKPSNFRVMTFNVHYETREAPQLLDLVQKEKPDVIFLQENKGDENSPAAYVQRHLPGWSMQQAGEVAILSRWTLADIQTTPLHSVPGRVILSAEVMAPKPFRAMTTHWSVPQWRTGFVGLQRTMAAQEQDFRDTQAAIDDFKGPLILGGDFNNPPAHPFTQALSARMINAFSTVGRGAGWTFPKRIPLVRIDHLYSTQDIEPARSWVGPTAGSDHRCLFAEFGWH